MARKVFFSFHFKKDFSRTQQIRNMNALEGNKLVTANRWEEVKAEGDAAIEKWIDDEMFGKSCVVVLVGSETAERKWVLKEICKGWDKKKGILGIRINRLLDFDSKSDVAGNNPFDAVTIGGSTKLSTIAPLKVPTGADSKAVYADIANNIEKWIEEAIKVREDY